jgi:hypothetical protein
MIASASPKVTIQYDPIAYQRASCALCCSPFRLQLFRAMIQDSVPLPQMADRTGIDRNYTYRPLSENRVERELLWLIQVGLLRREVDGQGITDSFRLTPLGRQLIGGWQAQTELPKPSLGDRLRNTFRRWLSFSF